MGHVIGNAVFVLCSLACVPVLNRTVVAGDTAVDFRLFAADRAGKMLAGQISVILTDRIGGGHGIIRQLVIFRNSLYQLCRRFPVRQLLSQERMEYGSGGVKGLKLILDIQGVKDIRCISYRKVGAVGIIWSPALGGRLDIRIFFHIVLCQTVCCGLCRSRFQVV